MKIINKPIFRFSKDTNLIEIVKLSHKTASI